jgi:hypothetical protein
VFDWQNFYSIVGLKIVIMRRNYILIIAFTLILCFGCKKEQEESRAEEVVAEKPVAEQQTVKMESLWIEGEWINRSKQGDFTEIWKRDSDSTYAGESFVIVKKDTVFYESVSISKKMDTIFYSVSVRNQNKAKPVAFYATKNEANELVFENPKHDFPTKIAYSKITNDSMVAVVSGKGKSQVFPMKRKSN